MVMCMDIDQSIFSCSTTSANLIALEKIIAEELRKTKHLSFECLDQNIKVTYPIKTIVQSHSVVFTHMKNSIVGHNEDIQCKKTIICLHGANSGPSLWFDIVPTLVQQQYEVHCIALPGFGESIVDIDEILDLSPSMLKQFYVHYLDSYIKLNCSSVKPILLGHSFGGYIASAYAGTYPEYCDLIVLVNAAGIFPVFGRETSLWGTVFKSGFPNFYMRQLGYLVNSISFTYLSICNTSKAIDYWNIAQMTCSDSIGETLVSRFIYYDYCNISWNCPTLGELLGSRSPIQVSIIWGSDDTIVPLKYASMLSECFSNKASKLFTISNVWHNPVANTELFAKALLLALSNGSQLIHANEYAINKCIYDVKAEYSFYTTDNIINTMYNNLRRIIQNYSMVDVIRVI